MIEWVEIDQGVELTQQAADRHAKRFAVLGKIHHQSNEMAVFDLFLDEPAQNLPVDPVVKAPDVHLQGHAVNR